MPVVDGKCKECGDYEVLVNGLCEVCYFVKRSDLYRKMLRSAETICKAVINDPIHFRYVDPDNTHHTLADMAEAWLDAYKRTVK